MRIGLGYDVHQLVPERKLILGGVEIPHHLGLLGHSDADVLLHAVMDALLGAAAMGDIGRHFPDTDPRYRGISSLQLLRQVGILLRSGGFTPHQIDAIIVAEKPKLAPFIDLMRQNIAAALGMAFINIGVKATTTEGLGFAGRQEGIAAYSAVVIRPIKRVAGRIRR